MCSMVSHVQQGIAPEVVIGDNTQDYRPLGIMDETIMVRFPAA